LLKEFEELWAKTMSPDVEMLLALNSSGVDHIPALDDGKGSV